MAQQESMSMLDFMKRFDSEEKYRDYLFHMRWPEGFVCPKCGVRDKLHIPEAESHVHGENEPGRRRK